MPTYYEKLRDPRWQRKRLEILNRDKFACLECGDKESTLHVHHVHYEKNPWETDDQFLITLCAECHEIRQSLEDSGKLALAKIYSCLSDNGKTLSSLSAFVESIELVANGMIDDEEHFIAPKVCDHHEYVNDSETRWFWEAAAKSDFREAYQRLVGRKVKWGISEKMVALNKI